MCLKVKWIETNRGNCKPVSQQQRQTASEQMNIQLAGIEYQLASLDHTSWSTNHGVWDVHLTSKQPGAGNLAFQVEPPRHAQICRPDHPACLISNMHTLYGTRHVLLAHTRKLPLLITRALPPGSRHRWCLAVQHNGGFQSNHQDS